MSESQKLPYGGVRTLLFEATLDVLSKPQAQRIPDPQKIQPLLNRDIPSILLRKAWCDLPSPRGGNRFSGGAKQPFEACLNTDPSIRRTNCPLGVTVNCPLLQDRIFDTENAVMALLAGRLPQNFRDTPASLSRKLKLPDIIDKIVTEPQITIVPENPFKNYFMEWLSGAESFKRLSPFPKAFIAALSFLKFEGHEELSDRARRLFLSALAYSARLPEFNRLYPNDSPGAIGNFTDDVLINNTNTLFSILPEFRTPSKVSESYTKQSELPSERIRALQLVLTSISLRPM